MTGVTWWDLAVNLWPVWVVKGIHFSLTVMYVLLFLAGGACLLKYLRSEEH